MPPPTPQTKHLRPLAFILNVRMTLHPSSLPTFLAAIKPAYEAVLLEPECVFFNLGVREEVDLLGASEETSGEKKEDEEAKCVVSFSEGWNCTLDWFRDVQLKRDYYGPYRAVTVPLLLEPREYFLPILFSCSVCWELKLWFLVKSERLTHTAFLSQLISKSSAPRRGFAITSLECRKGKTSREWIVVLGGFWRRVASDSLGMDEEHKPSNG